MMSHELENRRGLDQRGVQREPQRSPIAPGVGGALHPKSARRTLVDQRLRFVGDHGGGTQSIRAPYPLIANTVRVPGPPPTWAVRGICSVVAAAHERDLGDRAGTARTPGGPVHGAIDRGAFRRTATLQNRRGVALRRTTTGRWSPCSPQGCLRRGVGVGPGYGDQRMRSRRSPHSSHLARTGCARRSGQRCRPGPVPLSHTAPAGTPARDRPPGVAAQGRAAAPIARAIRSSKAPSAGTPAIA